MSDNGRAIHPKRGTFSEIKPYLGAMRPFWFLLLIGLILNLMAMASSVGLVTLSSWFLNASALAGVSITTAFAFNYALPSAGVRLFATARTITRYGERTLTHEGTFKILSRLRTQIYRAIEPLSPSTLQQIGSSELSTRLTADVDALDALYVRVLVPSIVALLTIIGYGVIIGLFSPFIGLFCALCLLISGVLGPLLAWKRGHVTSTRWQVLDGELRAELVERLDSFAELSLYGQWDKEKEKLLEKQKERDRAQMTLSSQWGDSQLLSMFLLGLSMSGALILAAWWARHYGLSDTMVATIALGLLSAFEAVMMLPEAWQQLGKVRQAATRLNELQEAVPTITFPEQDQAEPHSNDIEIQDVSLRYDQEQVLNSMSLSLASGEHLALIGHSGGGKTSLLNLLVRFIEPTTGTIRFGGVETKQLSEAHLRRIFAVATQDVQIFSADFRDNLRMGRNKISDQQIIDMLKALDLGDWLEHQPEGLDTWPDEGGASLSGGQLRRFGLARALLSPAPVVLLDEPTEGLDRETQQLVMAHIKACCKDRSLMMITHRLGDLAYMDRYALIEKGSVIETGSPQRSTMNDQSKLAYLYQGLQI
ncbi:putative ABC transporter ATP-binding/permease protein [Halomonadaceae bacterium LMG 33818]|uniref:thiol reductant ABC exporter subunit CydC n=1 Tax=Cernens ardua TaxID=3402176 RepID=UPI003EDB9A56